MKLAELPTLNDVGCSSCHALLDPVAGGFKNWRNKGNYREGNRWTICDEISFCPEMKRAMPAQTTLEEVRLSATVNQALILSLYRNLKMSPV